MEQEIKITGARQHNLKNVSVNIPKNKLVVVTGPSGSGKSSLAFDTIYAEGQRRYVESLSSYARQFLGMSDKPDVDDITGLSPAISIEQKGTGHNPRSTVGTVTEIYDYLRLLFGRAGTPHCPKCGREVHRYSVDEIIDLIFKEYDGKPLEIYSPVVKAKKGEYKNLLLKLHQQGYMRARIDGTLYWLEETVELDKKRRHTIECLIDRMKVREDNRSRLSEAVEIVNLFVPKGQKVVYTKGKLASVNAEYHTTKEPLDATIPLVVLVNGGTASSAEIVSGALQDMDRAVIMGSRTYGKGLVQIPREVPYHGSLKVTTSRYYIPSGRCIQAYDYRHLNADGSVGTVPDSLTHEFSTAAGRPVRDGGGIKPDVVTPEDSLPTLVYDIVASDVTLEYVCKYASEHPTIAPAGEFSLSDEDYADFVKMVEESGFKYKRRTEDVMNLLKQTARFEGCFEGAEAEFEALQKKMSGDTAADMMRFKEDIKPFIENDIVSRYYYRRGALLQQAGHDNDVKAATELLANPAEYAKLLKPQK